MRADFISLILFCVRVFFFFKQKTAYELLISDWSSDVCSSGLILPLAAPGAAADSGASALGGIALVGVCGRACSFLRCCFGCRRRLFRSEEHTSELQSLMRISYAVFCLKKKNKQQIH